MPGIQELGPGQGGEESTEENLPATPGHWNSQRPLPLPGNPLFLPTVGLRGPRSREDRYLVCKVDDNEGCVGHAWFLEVLAVGVSFVELLGPVLISSFGDLENHKTGYSAS